MAELDYLNFNNLDFLSQLYEKYSEDPNQIEASWRYLFDGMALAKTLSGSLESKDFRIFHLIEAYRKFGHLIANYNPLEIKPKEKVNELDLKNLNFEEHELKELFPTMGLLEKKEAPLEDIINTLKDIYCGSVGVEFHYSTFPEMENWLTERIEKEKFRPKLGIDEKKMILDKLNKATLFEIFLHTKYVGQKRFSLEGGETLIPILNELIEKGAESGMEEFILGMSHRGRLNVLTNIFKKSYSIVFSEFEHSYESDTTKMGDVKYHKGFSSVIKTSKGKDVHISLPANPSHLESVDPVVEGKAFAKQKIKTDTKKTKVLPVLIHGDAAVAGQGVVYETLQLSKLDGYSTGGTIHIIINNQIGFTTLPKDSRSTRYASDIAKAFTAPVFHVNAEDPESCIAATILALEIRQKFHVDVFIDLNCYRKYGHNEGDEPFFTQPLEYEFLKKKKSIREIYHDKLIEEGSIEKEVAIELEEEFKKNLSSEFEQVKQRKIISPEDAPFQGDWKKYKAGASANIFEKVNTQVPVATLKELAEKFCKVPQNFTPHPKVAKLFQDKLKTITNEGNIDWATAELLALSSLLNEKTPVRLAGQDSRRGTFSQRHACLVDQKTGEFYFPLSQFAGASDIIDSPLSEYAALGFEFGYSLTFPDSLVIWEAQYGDFSNGAQIVTDQYISSSEEKWQRYSGLTLLLPHGYEGQGPEHSSARLERFLQLAGNKNMQVVFPTMPAQYFHLLRRQVLRLIRKPLIIFTPKSLLRHPLCVNPLKEFASNGFQEIIDENKEKVDKVLFCSGKVYFNLIEEREKQKKDTIAIVRIEQLFPLHEELLAAIFKKYQGVKDFCWVQEEPKNMGSWHYILPYLLKYLPADSKLDYVGRKRRAAPASGSNGVFIKEELEIIKKALEYEDRR